MVNTNLKASSPNGGASRKSYLPSIFCAMRILQFSTENELRVLGLNQFARNGINEERSVVDEPKVSIGEFGEFILEKLLDGAFG